MSPSMWYMTETVHVPPPPTEKVCIIGSDGTYVEILLSLEFSLSCGLYRSHDRFRRNQALGVTDFTCTEWCKKQMENVLCIGRRKVNRELKNKSPSTDTCRSSFGLLSKIGAKPSFGNLHTFKV